MADAPQFVVLTGLSGSGKTLALNYFEDLDYYCVDNLPVSLVPTLAELAMGSKGPNNPIAVCVDARAGDELQNLPAHLDQVEELGFYLYIIFLESSDEVLKRRYSVSRRRHPASPAGSTEEGISIERKLLAPIRLRADLVVDTSAISVQELRDRITERFAGGLADRTMAISIISFGFKYGIPQEADLVLDARFLPNPYYEASLRKLPGTKDEVREFVLESDSAQAFLDHLRNFLAFLIPQYAAEPKSYLTIAVGCTGGRHRSVVIAGEISRMISDMGRTARIHHRDVGYEGEA